MWSSQQLNGKLCECFYDEVCYQPSIKFPCKFRYGETTHKYILITSGKRTVHALMHGLLPVLEQKSGGNHKVSPACVRAWIVPHDCKMHFQFSDGVIQRKSKTVHADKSRPGKYQTGTIKTSENTFGRLSCFNAKIAGINLESPSGPIWVVVELLAFSSLT